MIFWKLLLEKQCFFEKGDAQLRYCCIIFWNISILWGVFDSRVCWSAILLNIYKNGFEDVCSGLHEVAETAAEWRTRHARTPQRANKSEGSPQTRTDRQTDRRIKGFRALPSFRAYENIYVLLAWLAWLAWPGKVGWRIEEAGRMYGGEGGRGEDIQ